MRRGEGKEQYSDSNFAVLPSGWWTWNFRQGCKGVLLASTGLRWPVTTRSLPPSPRGGGGGGKGEEEEGGYSGPLQGFETVTPVGGGYYYHQTERCLSVLLGSPRIRFGSVILSVFALSPLRFSCSCSFYLLFRLFEE